MSSSRFSWLHTWWSYEVFRLVCSYEPVPTEMVNHRSGVWSWMSQFGSSLMLFFFSSIICHSAKNCHVITYIPFPFCQFNVYLCCPSFSHLSEGWPIILLLNSTGNYLLPEKQKCRIHNKKRQNTQNNIAGGMKGKRSPLVRATPPGSSGCASLPLRLPPTCAAIMGPEM